eukprot:3212384-Rhodomonas_salina.1
MSQVYSQWLNAFPLVCAITKWRFSTVTLPLLLACGVNIQPSKAQYVHWLDSFSKILLALLYGWIVPMALELEFRDGNWIPLVNKNHPDDPSDFVFQYVVVARAIAAGALDSLPKWDEPLEDHCHCSKNYQYIVNSIALFSSQLSTCCSGTFQRLFVNQNLHIAPHPWTCLREFATLHSIYVVENKIENSLTAWIKAFAALH